MWSTSAASAMQLWDTTHHRFADLYQSSYQNSSADLLKQLSKKNKPRSRSCWSNTYIKPYDNLFNLPSLLIGLATFQEGILDERIYCYNNVDSQQFSYYTNVYCSMIFQKDKRNDLQAKPNTNKKVKPYSIFSLTFMKPLDKNNGNRSREIPNIVNNGKTSIKAFKSQNLINQNAIPIKSKQILTNSSLVDEKEDKSHQNTSGIYSRPICQAESLELIPMDEEISQRPQKLKLNNLTNQILQDPLNKRKDSLQKGIFSFCELDQPLNDQKHERIYVDMKKKIKKLSNGKKRLLQSDKLKAKPEEQLMNLLPHMEKTNTFSLSSRIYSDSQVIIDGSIFRNKLISQRIDNDVDTDDQQIASGIRRLHKSLFDATQMVQEQRKEDMERQRIFEMEFF